MTDRSTVEERCVACFEQVVGVPPVRGLDTAPADVPEWSSLAQVYLLVALEREFGAELDAGAFTYGGTLRDVSEHVVRAVRA